MGDSSLSDPPTITIDSDGDFFGTNGVGYTYTGAFKVSQSDRNVYEVSLLIENCSQYNGTYSGLATVLSGSLFAFASNAFYSWPFILEKQ